MDKPMTLDKAAHILNRLSLDEDDGFTDEEIAEACRLGAIECQREWDAAAPDRARIAAGWPR